MTNIWTLSRPANRAGQQPRAVISNSFQPLTLSPITKQGLCSSLPRNLVSQVARYNRIICVGSSSQSISTLNLEGPNSLTKRTQEFRDQDRLERSYTFASDTVSNKNIEIPS